MSGALTDTSILAGAAGAGGYTIDQSLRFNLGDSASLSRTPGSDGNRKTWTFSFWYKCVDPSFPGDRDILSDSQAGPPTDEHWFRLGIRGANNQLLLFPGYNYNIYATDAFFRDVGAWYHIVLRVDTTQASFDDRLRIYVNNELKTITNVSSGSSGVPPQDWVTGINSTDKQELMVYSYGTDVFCDGYLAEVHLVDGQSLTPSSFAEVNDDTNQWTAIKYAGTYGTNGFLLKFEDSADLGNDSSGNGNDYTVTNLVATDQVKDSPTNNFCTLNPVNGEASAGGRKSYQTLSEGSLKSVGSSGSDTGVAPGTWSFGGSGKWYFEFVATAYNGNYPELGMIDVVDSDNQGGYVTNGVVMRNDGQKVINSSNSSYGSSQSVGDVIGMAVDCDNGAAYFSINNTWQDSGDPTSGGSQTGAAYTWTAGTIEFTPTISAWNTSSGAVANFGQDSSFAGEKTAQGNGGAGFDFYYTPPANYLALATNNLSDPSIALPGEHFNTVLYTGTEDTLAVSGVGFQPELIWIKDRTFAENHGLTDVIRGPTCLIGSNLTAAEGCHPTYIHSFDSDGFTVGSDTWLNKSGQSHVAWNWKAGGTPTVDNSAGVGATPTAGSVKIDGSNLGSALAGTTAATRLTANTTNGFSIIKYVGTGSAATIAHGLSSAPELYILKKLAAGAWPVWSAAMDMNKYLQLNSDASQATDTGPWNNTSPTASVWSVGADSGTNENTANFIAYLFHSVEGYSKVGSFTGNGSGSADSNPWWPEGPFVYTGFTPEFLIIKQISTVDEGWSAWDGTREPYNTVDLQIDVNGTRAEYTANALTFAVDFLSNGFKIDTAYSSMNKDAKIYLYYAVAKSPFKYSNAR